MLGNFFVVLLVLGLIFPQTAHANGLPHFAVQENPNGAISPLNKVPVVVDKEVLTIKLSGKDPALIKAKYSLKSLSDNRISTTVIFPVADRQKASVIFDGHPLEIKQSPFFPDLYAEDFEVSKTWIDPYSNYRYVPKSPGNSSDASYSPLRLKFISFQIEFEPKEESTLEVTYAQRPSYDTTWLFRDINYRFDYILQPAKHWANFKDLEINVLIDGKISLASSIVLRKVGQNHFQAKYDELPKDNLSLFVGTKPSRFKGSLGSYLFNRLYSIEGFAILLACLLVYIAQQKISGRKSS